MKEYSLSPLPEGEAEVLDQTLVRSDPSLEMTIYSTPLSPSTTVETLGTLVGGLLAEELEKRRKRKGKGIPAEVLNVNDSKGKDAELPPGLSHSHSSMGLGILVF